MVDPVQNLGDSFRCSVEKVFLCAGADGYVPKYSPKDAEYGCLADSASLLHRFKIVVSAGAARVQEVRASSHDCLTEPPARAATRAAAEPDSCRGGREKEPRGGWPEGRRGGGAERAGPAPGAVGKARGGALAGVARGLRVVPQSEEEGRVSWLSRAPQKRKGCPPHTRTGSPEHQCPKEGPPQQEAVTSAGTPARPPEGCCSPWSPEVPLRRAHGHTHCAHSPEAPVTGRGVWGSCSCRTGAGETELSEAEVPTGISLSLCPVSPTQPVGGRAGHRQPHPSPPSSPGSFQRRWKDVNNLLQRGPAGAQ